MYRFSLEPTYHPLRLRRLQTSPFLSPDSRTMDCLALDSKLHHWRREEERDIDWRREEERDID